MKIDIHLVKELRDITFAPLGDCKKALEEADGDITKAQEILKEKWVLKAGKKSDRETHCGMVKFVHKNNTVIGVKVLCETDFVAKNDMFKKLVDEMLEKVSSLHGDFDLGTMETKDKEALEQFIYEHVATIGENLQLGGVYKKEWKAYVYNHMGNTVASVVFYEGDDETAAKDAALQVAAMNPMYLSMEEIPASQIAEKTQEFTEELASSNKPADIISKIVAGKVQKHFQDDVLLEQLSIKDSTKKVQDLLRGIKITSMMRVTIG